MGAKSMRTFEELDAEHFALACKVVKDDAAVRAKAYHNQIVRVHINNCYAEPILDSQSLEPGNSQVLEPNQKILQGAQRRRNLKLQA